MTSSVIISIHAPHAGSDGHGLSCTIPELVFQSTLPMRGATVKKWSFYPMQRISIHAPHAGSDWIKPTPTVSIKISIHAPHAGSDRSKMTQLSFPPISIHAPHAGSDSVNANLRSATLISIHAPHAGSDILFGRYSSQALFQSTLPMRGAWPDARLPALRLDFNPRSPCGERKTIQRTLTTTYYFNPRSPCGERIANIFF